MTCPDGTRCPFPLCASLGVCHRTKERFAAPATKERVGELARAVLAELLSELPGVVLLPGPEGEQ